MNKFLLIILFFSGFCRLESLAQQDIHSSFWDKSPTISNPAAPILGYGKLSLFTGMRMQWLPVGSKPMRTNTAMFLAKLGEGMDDGFFTMGAHFHNDQSGNGSLTTTGISFPVNYSLKIDRYRLLSIGLSPGIMNRTFENRGTWGNQWAGTSFDQSFNSGEVFTAANSFRFDIGSGIFYQQKMSNNNHFYIGASVDHLVQPKNALLAFSEDEVRYRYVVQSSLLINTRNLFLSYKPSFYGSWQGGNYNFVGGLEFIYHAKERSRILVFEEGIDFNFGVFYRYMDAVIGRLSYRNRGFEAGISYDITLSRLTRATKSFGAAELFVKFNFVKNNHIYDARL